MKIAKVAVAGVVASGAVVSALTAVSPANAACTNAGKWTSYNVADSTKFDASTYCDGVWGIRAASYSDPVRGRFLKDGSWQVSSYGWTYIYTGNDSDVPKIVGNTIDSRDIKGQSFTYGQTIYYKF